jgi:hypothetical protein
MFGRVNDCTRGNVGRGTTCPDEKLTVEGAVSLDETTAPSASSGYGKVYVKSAEVASTTRSLAATKQYRGIGIQHRYSL